MSPRVLVSIVTYNSARHLEACLESVRQQTFGDFVVSLWDNASADRTVEIATCFHDLLYTSHFSGANLGFAAGHNRILASIQSEYVLVLNPDVMLESGFLEILVGAMQEDKSAGAATGKLWRWPVTGTGGATGSSNERILDTTGIYLTPNQRHLDRGAGEPDSGQYESRQYVFGASGAAAFYRRTMLEEVKAGEEYFDESFFSYREDADLAWRAQWLGWRCLYVPEARAFHVRRVLPERRSSLAPEINMHSFKNRFLLRLKNMDAGTYLRFFLPITARDLLAFGYVLLRERSSLRALPLLFRASPGAWAVRRALARHRRVSPRKMRDWFSYRPIACPVALPPSPSNRTPRSSGRMTSLE